MVDIPEIEMETWKSGRQKNLVLRFEDGRTITGEDIYSESMTIEQTLSDEQNIKYGKCSSACFKIRISDSALGFKNTKFSVDISCGDYVRQLGTYKVFSDNRTDDRKYRDLVAYDSIYDLQSKDCTEWYKGLAFPLTMKSFRDSFFSFVGIEQKSANLPNDSMSIEKTIDPSSINGLTVAESICEMNARFGQIGSDGKFKYIDIDNNLMGLYPKETLYPDEDLYPKDSANATLTKNEYTQGSFRYEDFETANVTKVTIREQESDVGGSAGSGDNTYYITGNFLAYGQSSENLRRIAGNILNEITQIHYHPASVTTISFMPWIELGDFIRVIGTSDTIVFPILKKTISGITGSKETYEANGTETMAENQTSISDQITQLKGQSNVLTRTIEETQSTITKLEQDTDGKVQTLQTQITQNATDISLEATRATGAEETLSSRIAINSQNITAEVTRAESAESSLSSRITINADGISSEVTRATGAESSLSSRISQSAHEISMSVSGNVGQNSSAGITISLLDENGNMLDSGSGNITLDGNVVFKSNLTDGTTQISGDNITTGKIKAQYLDVDTLESLGATIAGFSISDNQIYQIYSESSGISQLSISAAGSDGYGSVPKITMSQQTRSSSAIVYETELSAYGLKIPDYTSGTIELGNEYAVNGGTIYNYISSYTPSYATSAGSASYATNGISKNNVSKNFTTTLTNGYSTGTYVYLSEGMWIIIASAIFNRTSGHTDRIWVTKQGGPSGDMSSSRYDKHLSSTGYSSGGEQTLHAVGYVESTGGYFDCRVGSAGSSVSVEGSIQCIRIGNR